MRHGASLPDVMRQQAHGVGCKRAPAPALPSFVMAPDVVSTKAFWALVRFWPEPTMPRAATMRSPSGVQVGSPTRTPSARVVVVSWRKPVPSEEIRYRLEG